jgi:hypothetical protein
MCNQRDRQRSRVYAWEKAASTNLTRMVDGQVGIHRHTYSEFETLAQCSEFLAPIWAAERGRYGRSRVPMPTIERPSWGQRSALAHWDHRITLPKWARNRWVILHEAAHRLTPGDEAHGPRFVGVLIGLLARHGGYDAYELMAAADEAGVKYHVRSVGSVPVQSLSERLHRLLPVQEMDAAFELDVSWRQVRGASLQLVRAGLAIWKRDRLLPIERQQECSLAI